MTGAFWVLLLLVLPGAGAFAASVQGEVRDVDTNLPLAGAVITVVDTTLGTVSDPAGRFVVRLPAGSWVLEVSHIGYTTVQLAAVTLADDSTTVVDVLLRPRAIGLREMVITPGAFAIMGDAGGSHQALTEEEISSIPQFGEDIFRAVTRLPGVAGNDFSARFTVRGGDNDEVLVRVDGIELYDPFHLKDIGGGALSIIDVGLIRGVDLLTGGYPAEFGNRLSGVFDVHTRTPAPGTHRAALGLSMMNARALVEGASERSAWLVSARRGYLDLVMGLMGEDEDFSPGYSDIFAKFVRRLDDRHEVQSSLLYSRDDLDFVEDDDDRSRTGYDNAYAWLTLRSSWSSSLLTRSSVMAGRITQDRNGVAFYDDTGERFYTVTDERSFNVLALQQDWSLAAGESHFFKWGFDARRLDASYDYLSQQLSYFRRDDGTLGSALDTSAVVSAPDGNRLGLYAADRIRLAERFTSEIGLRFDHAGYADDNVLSPRLNLVYQVGRQTWLRAGWGRFYQSQGIDQLGVGDGETAFHDAERATHTVLGFEHLFHSGVHLRVEAYRKHLTSLRPEYRNWLNQIEIFPELQNDRVRVELDGALSRGLELYLKRDTGGSLTWWASYALARVEDDLASIGPAGATAAIQRMVAGRYDQRHTVYVDANWRPDPRWRLNVAWQYRTGWPFTDRTLHIARAVDGSSFLYDEVGPLNGASYPAFHRLDLRLNRTFNTGGGRLHAFVELTNVYNHGNVRTYEFSPRCSDGATPECRYHKLPEYWFRLLPSIGLTWDWDL